MLWRIYVSVRSRSVSGDVDPIFFTFRSNSVFPVILLSEKAKALCIELPIAARAEQRTSSDFVAVPSCSIHREARGWDASHPSDVLGAGSSILVNASGVHRKVAAVETRRGPDLLDDRVASKSCVRFSK